MSDVSPTTSGAEAAPAPPDVEPFRIEGTCCGRCYDAVGGHCYVDQVTGA